MKISLQHSARAAFLGSCALLLAAATCLVDARSSAAAPLVPVNIVADNQNAVNGNTSAFTAATDGVIDHGASGQVNGFDTWHGDSVDPTFAGLTYGSLETFSQVEMYMGHQFVDGGNFGSLPALYVLTNNVYTGTTRPSDDPTDWTLVSPSHYAVISGTPSAVDAVGPGPTLPYNYSLTTPVAGYGWALEGQAPGTPNVNGGAPFSFISVTELQGFSTPEPSALILGGLAALCGLGMVVRRRASLVGVLKAPVALLLVGAGVLALTASPVVASTIPGTAILGVNAGGVALATTGTPFFQANNPAAMTDGNTGTYDTTCCGTTGSPFTDSYAGLNFTAPVTSPAGLQVDVVFHIFVDGGWFGTNGAVPDPITSALVAPVLQVTTDGTHWTTVASTSNYISTLSGLSPVFQATGDVTFTTHANLNGITEFRVIGPGGGNQPGNNGFLGVAEISASIIPTPEPSTLILSGLGLVGLVIAARRRRG